MHYSPSDKDGVFVVEVARGADTSYHSPRTCIGSQQHQQQQQFGVDLLNTLSTPVESVSSVSCSQEQQQQQQRVQVHHHPPPTTAAAESATVNGKLKSNTGLSQSDLSDSSSGGGSNKDYNYGNQGGPYTTAADGAATVEHRAYNATTQLTSEQRTAGGVVRQETIDLEPRLQSDIDLFNVETERLEHCNGHAQGGKRNTSSSSSNSLTNTTTSSNGLVPLPDILVKGQPVVESVES